MGARARADEGADDLAPLRVRQSHHGGIGDIRVGRQDVLDFARVDVLPAADDHVP
jgi:hypothetical protein